MDRHSKKDAKQQKINSKNDSTISLSRQVPISHIEAERQLRQLEQQRSQELAEDPLYRKAKRFWTRFNEKYFKNLTINDLTEMRELTTSNQIITIGTLQPTAFSHYSEEILQTQMPSIIDPNTLKVIFKNKKQPSDMAIASYEIQASNPGLQSESSDIFSQEGIKITNMVKKQQQNVNNSKSKNIITRSMKLSALEYSEDSKLCQRIEKYNEIQKIYVNDIDKEIAIWEYELFRVTQENNSIWNKILREVSDNPGMLKVKSTDEHQKQIAHIQNKLMWSTVLRSFESGFKDKTKKMLENYIENQKNFNNKPPKGLASAPKKYFETDCKICFCSDYNDSNQVLYCDSCNTSYHLACYGLNSIPKEDPYYCERCSFAKKQSYLGVRTKNIYCQICSKNNFPMKKIDDHFYHVTCLILFNFVEMVGNRMVLKNSLNHKKIADMVIQNQIISEDCDFCRKSFNNPSTNSIGMKIKCSYDVNCSHYYHPICAYLSGCKFIVKRDLLQSLQVKLVCNSHFPSRVEQAYWRRYMLNFNDTSTKNKDEFQKQFDRQIAKRKQVKQSMAGFRNKYPNRILFMNRYIKNILKTKEEKQDDKIETETQMLLRRIKHNYS